VHRFQLDGQTAERIVLGDWYEHGSVLKVDGNGATLHGLGAE
jgi:UDP-2,3-diacylglucosamine hydrolase